MGLLVGMALSGSILVALVGALVTLAAALGGIAGFNAYKSAALGWKEERDAAVAKANRLEADVAYLKKKVDSLENEVAALREKDVSKLFDLMLEHHTTVARRSEEAHAEVMTMMQRIFDRQGT